MPYFSLILWEEGRGFACMCARWGWFKCHVVITFFTYTHFWWIWAFKQHGVILIKKRYFIKIVTLTWNYSPLHSCHIKFYFPLHFILSSLTSWGRKRSTFPSWKKRKLFYIFFLFSLFSNYKKRRDSFHSCWMKRKFSCSGSEKCNMKLN